MTHLVFEIARHELFIALRTRRAIAFAALYLGSALLGGLGVVLSLRVIEQQALARLAEEGMDPQRAAATLSLISDPAYEKMVSFFAGVESGELADLFLHSAVVPFCLWGSLAFLPFLILLTSFDQVSADLQSRSILYSALRAPRAALLAGKMLAQTVLFLTLTVLALGGVLIVASLVLTSLPLGETALALGRVILTLVPFGLCYLSVSAFCSSSTRQPFLALLASLGVIIALRVLGVFGNIPPDHALAPLRYLEWLSPAHYQAGLWMKGLWGPLSSSAAYLGFAAAFMALAAWRLSRRDL